MKHAFLIVVLLGLLIGSTIFLQPKTAESSGPLVFTGEPNEGHLTAYCVNVKGYDIVTGKTLEKLKENVQAEIGGDWYPLSGVTYDPNEKQYLQVIVHPRTNAKYPAIEH